MSELVVKEILSDEYVNQVRTFGALNYTPERICQLLALRKAKREALLYRITLPGDVYFEAYQHGHALGFYKIVAQLAKTAANGDHDSITLLEERKNERAEKDLRMKLFGI